jgi:ribonuclease BN (tRNA processing enzyme)
MIKLIFIGVGSAFNTNLGNTSAFIRTKDTMLLIDCGGTVFHRFMDLKLLEGLKQLNIIITHTHPDHVGSLGEVIFFAHYVLKIVPKIYFPDTELIGTFLRCIGIEEKMVIIIGNLEVKIHNQELGDFSLSFLPVSHLPTIPAFGFILENKDSRIYYSGDANAIPRSVMRLLEEGNLDIIFQDTCGLDYNGNAHLSLRKLCDIIPENLRKKVYCIHHDSFLDVEEVRELGFNLPEIYNG